MHEESAMQRKDIDRDSSIVSAITSNEQATHNQVVSNSVGMTVLHLRSYYLGKIPTQEALDQHYETCIDKLRALKVSDFFKPGDEEKPENAALKKEIAEQSASLIDYIVTQANQPSYPELDCVTLFIKGDDDIYKEETYELPLRVVLPLLLTACNDSDKFKHNYSGSEEQKLQLAEEDKPLRLLSLFRCLQRARAGICHTGVRNELILQLNGTYEGIHIIEDTAATVEYFLKDHIYKKFWETYHKSANQDSEQNKKLLSAIFIWMTDRNPLGILEIIDPEHRIEKELAQCFIDNGSDPKKLTVKYDGESMPFVPFVQRSTSRLNFASDPKQPVLTFIQALLNADNDIDHNPLRNKALSKMQDWIHTHYCLNSPALNSKVASFYAVYDAEQKLTHYKSLLILTGSMTDEAIQILQQACRDYYQDFNSSNESFRNEGLLNKIKELNTIVGLSKKNNLHDKIENFLAFGLTG